MAQAAAWLDLQPEIELTANLSPARLLAPDLLAAVDEALAAAELDPQHLAVAVPLGAVAVDPVPLARTMGGLARRGVRVVMDGVGAGASLSAIGLVEAPIWRIDVRPARRRAAGLHPTSVEALERAHDLGAVAVACSADDAETLNQAVEAGLDRAMGRAIAAPVTALAAQGPVPPERQPTTGTVVSPAASRSALRSSSTIRPLR